MHADEREVRELLRSLQTRFDELDGYALEARAREVLAGLGFREALGHEESAVHRLAGRA